MCFVGAAPGAPAATPEAEAAATAGKAAATTAAKELAAAVAANKKTSVRILDMAAFKKSMQLYPVFVGQEPAAVTGK